MEAANPRSLRSWEPRYGNLAFPLEHSIPVPSSAKFPIRRHNVRYGVISFSGMWDAHGHSKMLASYPVISHMADIVPSYRRKPPIMTFRPALWQSGMHHQGSAGSRCLSPDRMIGTCSGHIFLLNVHCNQESQEKCQQLSRDVS